MELSKKERRKLLKEWVKSFKAINKTYGEIKKIFGISPESPCAEAMYDAHNKYTKTLARLVGDNWGNLQWFLWDNEAGKRGLEAGVKGREKPIRTIDDLIELIDS